jgi:hypothetical protein
MNKVDAEEAAGIVQRMMVQLGRLVPSQGRPGSDARTAIGDLKANAYLLLRQDALGPPFNDVFVLVRRAGATYPQLESVRGSTEAEQPLTLGATLVQNVGIELCLATQAEIIASMNFASRQDVDAIKKAIRQPFEDALEISADDMDQATFQAETALYAAVVNHLVTTARPLPRLINYQFTKTMTTLTLAYRLYGDASRADELRAENKIVHPAFCPVTGIALSA